MPEQKPPVNIREALLVSAYNEGADAKLKGQYRNLYEPDTPLWHKWEAGYRDAN